MLTNDLVPCFVQTFKTDSKTGYGVCEWRVGHL